MFLASKITEVSLCGRYIRTARTGYFAPPRWYEMPGSAGRTKTESETGNLTEGRICPVLIKTGGSTRITVPTKKIRDYFPAAYTSSLLEEGRSRTLRKEKEQMKEIQFNYFHDTETEYSGQYNSFYRIPRELFTQKQFKPISFDAKILYGLMLNRVELSMKNHWHDEENKVYIIFTVKQIMELMECRSQKAEKLLKELDKIGLIEKKRQGLGRPNVIYVKNFMTKDSSGRQGQGREGMACADIQDSGKQETGTSGDGSQGISWTVSDAENQNIPEQRTDLKIENQGSQNQQSADLKIEIQDIENQNSGCRKSKTNQIDPNQTDINKTDLINPISSISSNPILTDRTDLMDKMDKIDETDVIKQKNLYREIIRENIAYYGTFQYLSQDSVQLVDELVELMTEVMTLPDDSTLRIAKIERPAAIVKSQFMKIGYSEIEYVKLCLCRNSTKVRNIKSYLLTTLYNAPMTDNHYYLAEVQHDYGSGY